MQQRSLIGSLWGSLFITSALGLIASLLSDAGVEAGTGDDIQCIPPPPPPAPPLTLPQDSSEPMRDLEMGSRLWLFLQQETYRQRGEGFREEWAFHMLAASKHLGAPLARSAGNDQRVSVSGKAYGYQPFARDMVYNEIPQWTQISRLGDVLKKTIPSSGLGRELLSASYKACGTTLKADQAFAVRVVQDELGPALTEGFTLELAGTRYDIQIFAQDVLYSPVGDYANIKRLSDLTSGAIHDSLWAETYRRLTDSSYDPTNQFHKKAIATKLGVPLTGVYRSNFEGNDVDIQVWSLDTIFAEPNSEARLQSSLPKPSFSINDTVTPIVPQPGDALADSTPVFGILPIAGQPQISQFYGYTRFSAGNGRVYYGATQGRHSGLDFAVPVGTELLAIEYGLVVWAGDNVAGVSFGAGPQSIIVRYGNIYALYGHTSRVAVSVGDSVTPGQVIGYTGFPSAPHLHFEFRPVPADMLGNRDSGQRPKNPGYTTNPVNYFSTSLKPYFDSQLSILGGDRGHFCQGNAQNQDRIVFGGPVDNRGCQ